MSLVLPLLTVLFLTAPSARAEGVGLTLGPSVGGGSLVGGVVQAQLSRPVFLEADLGYRAGWAVGEGYYPNVMIAAGVAAQFGERPWRNGFFAKVGTTAPVAFYEAWVAFGWSARIWGPKDIRSFTMDFGPAVYIVRDLPSNVDLGEVPLFAHLRVAWHFPVLSRAGNESVRLPPREKKRRKGDDEPAPEAAPDPTPAPAPPPEAPPGS
ncbi:MAG: hypothetical protein Q8P18_17300 [Pseudomonadota bacterium]|nr:hypothetical protein [Pseudomonadota bacterium]